MNMRIAAILWASRPPRCPVFAAEAPLARPKAGKVEIMPLSEVKPGMKGTAWTVFQGTEPEPVPIEIIGVLEERVGAEAGRHPGQDGRQGHPHQRGRRHERQPGLHRRQAGGRGGAAPSVFSPDAICGITPIELMLEINDFDKSRPDDARTPDKLAARAGGVACRANCWASWWPRASAACRSHAA